MATNLIPDEEYRKIVELVPILTVDVILMYGDQFLLVQRAQEPLKGSWWIVGGRAQKGESTLQAAKRKVIEELGIGAKDFKLVGLYEDHYRKSSWGVPTSSVSVVYSATIETTETTPDKTITAVKLFDELPKRLTRKLILCQG